MKIIYVNSDLLEAPQKYIAHGVNCQGVMGSGLALAIRNKWPSVYDNYRKFYNEYQNRYSNTNFAFTFPEKLLGEVNISYQDENRTIANCFTQLNYGRQKNIRYVSYDAVAKTFNYLNWLIREEVKEIALPKIGAGLGGGDWNVIKEIIESECKDIQPYVYVM